jgi:hypothetical protein
MKVVINVCFGGFGLSADALQHMGISADEAYDLDRSDPRLVAAVEILGDRANGDCADLEVVEVPDDVWWIIQEYDGCEHIAEIHRIWR